MVSMPDHLDGQFSPLVALAALAPVTERLRLGTFVICAPWRHVGMLAKEVATLDVLSGGRVELGLGGGWTEPEFDALGVPFAGRLAVAAETVAALRALWQGETLDLPGPYFSGTGLRCDPLPVQPGGPPIAIGAGGPRMLAVAGRVADIVSLIPSNAGRTTWWTVPEGIDRASVAGQVAIVRQAGSAGLNMRVLGVTPGADPLDAARTLAAERGHPTPASLVGSPYPLLGRPEDMAEQLAWNAADLGLSYYTISAIHGPLMAAAIELVR
jgi:probable F420-dependent oxidoreductase